MILITFKHIVVVFIMSIQMSRGEFPNKVVALLQIKGICDVEMHNDYFTRNKILKSDLTNKPYYFHIYNLNFVGMGEHHPLCYNLNTKDEVVMTSGQVNSIYKAFTYNPEVTGQSYLYLIFTLMRKRYHNKINNILDGENLLSWERQVQFYRFRLYPKINDTIYTYWRRVESRLINCVNENKNNELLEIENKYQEPDKKMEKISNIGFNLLNEYQKENEDLQDYIFRLSELHHWFDIMMSTKPLEGEEVESYYLRMIRLEFVPLRSEELRLFFPINYPNKYKTFWKSNYIYPTHKKDLNSILSNPSETELFVTHIICHCVLPRSEFKRPKTLSSRWNKVRPAYRSYFEVEESSSSSSSSKRKKVGH